MGKAKETSGNNKKQTDVKTSLCAGHLPEILRLRKLRNDVLASEYHICTQKASLLTDFMAERRKLTPIVKIISDFHFDLFKTGIEQTSRRVPQKNGKIRLNNFLNSVYLKSENISPGDAGIEYAKAIRHILRNMELKVYDGELIVGNPSAKRIGAPIHPDLGGIMMLPEIDGLDTRAQNPLGVTPEQKRELHEKIFPFWYNRSVLARTPLYSENIELSNILLDGRFFVLTQFAGVSHVTPDYSTVLKLGFNGIKEDIINKRKAAGKHFDMLKGEGRNVSGDRNELREKLSFYEAALISADAAIEYGRRWSEYLDKLARSESDTARRNELLGMAQVAKKVPAEPASTFHEALQSIFTTHVILHQESFQHGISYGRMDQYLYPYYAKDIEEGRLTQVEAAELFGCFLVKAGELLPLFFDIATEYFSGLSSASGITLGGENGAGCDGVNELSFLMLQAYDQVRLRQPNFHVRVNNDTPSAFIKLCCEVLKKGGGIPAFFNDHTIVPALEAAGITGEDAKDYSIVGCVEWGCPGKSFPAAGAIFVNMPMALHLALHGGKLDGKQFGPRTGDTDSLKSVSDILKAFRRQLQFIVSMAVEGNNAIEKAHAIHRPAPFLSIVVDGCIEKGKEINAGGATYNSTGCQGVGLADVVDSLSAIEKIVFNERKITLEELIAATDNNFENAPEIRSAVMNKSARYCENDELADGFANVVSGIYENIVFSFRNPRGGRYFPGFWSMTTHQGFGARMPALPGGRLAGEPLANGVSPCNGRDRLGPTAALASAARLDNSLVANGFAFNQKLNPDNLRGEKGNEIIEGLVRGYFDMGGMQVQFNMVDPETLIEAKKNPGKYHDLVVRVSGYSAYFNDLTEEMKDELIARTLHFSGDACRNN